MNLLDLTHFLREIDPTKRGLPWHHSNIIIFYTIHFKRGIDQAAGTASPLPIRQIMRLLLDAASKEHYFKILNVILRK